MSIAEKLVTVAENIPKVYNAGYLKGKSEGGGSGTDYFSYLTDATFSTDISEVTENIELTISRMNNVSQLFNNRALNCEKLTVRTSNTCSSFMNFMSTNDSYVGTIKEVEIIGNTSNVTTFLGAFNNRKTLEKIIGELDFSSCTNFTNAFANCSALRQITPKANTIKTTISFSKSSNLTDETIQAIIDGLADLTEQTAQTLSFHADVKAKLTDLQKNTITSKNWNLA